MKPFGRNFIVLFPIFFLFSCAPLLVPLEEDALRVRTEGRNISSTELYDAHRLYVKKCGSCHFVYRPYRYIKEEWAEVMPQMKTEAKLDSVQYESICRYLQVMCEIKPEDRKQKK